MSPACYEEITRKLTTSRGSYEELVPVEFELEDARVRMSRRRIQKSSVQWMSVSRGRSHERGAGVEPLMGVSGNKVPLPPRPKAEYF